MYFFSVEKVSKDAIWSKLGIINVNAEKAEYFGHILC